MRERVQKRLAVGLSATARADAIEVDVKRCPRCGTAWERNGGCNHFKCGSCDHHWCWICQGDWSTHGVSFFQCPMADKEKKSTKLVFSMDSGMLTGDMDVLHGFCEREFVHALAAERIQRILGEVSAMRVRQAGGVNAALALRSSVPPDPNFPPELPSLLADLNHPLLDRVAPPLIFLRECHTILRGTYVYFALKYKKLDVKLSNNIAVETARKLHYDCNALEYFVDALDATLIPAPSSRRSHRSIAQMLDTMATVRKYAAIFSQTMKRFQEEEARRMKEEEEEEGSGRRGGGAESEELSTKRFFQALDQAINDAGTVRRG